MAHISLSRNLDRSSSIEKCVLGEETIRCEPSEILCLAELRTELSTVVAFETHVRAGICANSVALLESILLLGLGAGFDDNSTCLVTGDQVVLEFKGYVFAEDGGKVRMTQRCRGDFDEKIARSRLGNGDVLDLEWCSTLYCEQVRSMDRYLYDDSGFHCNLSHDGLL